MPLPSPSLRVSCLCAVSPLAAQSVIHSCKCGAFQKACHKQVYLHSFRITPNHASLHAVSSYALGTPITWLELEAAVVDVCPLAGTRLSGCQSRCQPTANPDLSGVGLWTSRRRLRSTRCFVALCRKPGTNEVSCFFPAQTRRVWVLSLFRQPKDQQGAFEAWHVKRSPAQWNVHNAPAGVHPYGKP